MELKHNSDIPVNAAALMVGVAVGAFGEAFTLRLAIGMVVVLAAVVLVVVRRPVSLAEHRKERD